MLHRGDYQIEERLIGDALSEYMDRVNATREIWPEVRERLSRRSELGSRYSQEW